MNSMNDRYVMAIVCAVVLAIASAQTSAQNASTSTNGSSDLISQLTNGLNVSPTQARGGAGALFGLAKTRLTADEFSKVSSAVPGMSGLLKAAPASGGSSELSSLESELPGGLGSLASTAGAFNKLGLSPSMATKFAPIMTKYVESKGGASTASLLEKAWK